MSDVMIYVHIHGIGSLAIKSSPKVIPWFILKQLWRLINKKFFPSQNVLISFSLFKILLKIDKIFLRYGFSSCITEQNLLKLPKLPNAIDFFENYLSYFYDFKLLK